MNEYRMRESGQETPNLASMPTDLPFNSAINYDNALLLTRIFEPYPTHIAVHPRCTAFHEVDGSGVKSERPSTQPPTPDIAQLSQIIR